jgi:hypothetical protein
MNPANNPDNNGAPDARAMPRHRGRATRKTTSEAGMSAPRWARREGLLGVNGGIDDEKSLIDERADVVSRNLRIVHR